MTEQIAGQNAIVWAEIANIAYQDSFDVDDITTITDAHFTHIAPSTPNFTPYSYFDEFGSQLTGQVFDGFDGQAFISNDTKTLVIGLRGMSLRRRIGCCRMTMRYEVVRQDDPVSGERLKELAKARRRLGCPLPGNGLLANRERGRRCDRCTSWRVIAGPLSRM